MTLEKAYVFRINSVAYMNHKQCLKFDPSRKKSTWSQTLNRVASIISHTDKKMKVSITCYFIYYFFK